MCSVRGGLHPASTVRAWVADQCHRLVIPAVSNNGAQHVRNQSIQRICKRAKGGQWENADVVGECLVERAGGELVGGVQHRRVAVRVHQIVDPRGEAPCLRKSVFCWLQSLCSVRARC